MKKFFKFFLPSSPMIITGIITLLACFLMLPFVENYTHLTHFLKEVERKAFDLKYKIRGPLPGSDHICIATVDEKSISELGRWPWPRSRMAKLIRKLNEYGAKVIAFDAIFSEPDTNSALMLSKEIKKNYLSSQQPNPGFVNYLDKEIKQANTDWMFAEAVKEKDSVVLGYFWYMHRSYMPDPNMKFEDEIKKLEPSKILAVFDQSGESESKGTEWDQAVGVVVNIDEIQTAGANHGFFNAAADPDGLFRRGYLLMDFNGNLYPSLSLKALSKYYDNAFIIVATDSIEGQKRILNIKLGDKKTIKPDPTGKLIVNYRGPAKSFPHYSVSDIINDKDTIEGDLEVQHENVKVKKSKKDAFKDKIVLFGATAVGIYDLRATPFQADFPGVEIHANIINNIISDNYFQRPTEMVMYQILFMLILGLIYGFILKRLNAIWATVLTLVVMGSVIYVDYSYFYLKLNIINDLVIVILQLFLIFISVTIYKYMTEGRDKKFLKEAFSSYISPELIDIMYNQKTPPKLGGDSGIITAYFTDIASFSSFSEKLTATQLVELLNEYLTDMTDILLEEQGTLDKYEGDAIIAFFGAPMPLEDHAIRACRVAVKMQQRLDELRIHWEKQGDKWPTIVHQMRMRIGINTGDIVTGNMGSKNRMNYTMMGDSVNLAARLEAAAKQYGIFNQISSFTREHLGDHFELRELDTMRVVGKSEPVTTYELIGEKDQIDQNLRELIDLFHEGLALYKKQEWDQATAKFEQSLEKEYTRFPDLKEKPNPSKIYIERCKDYKENPPGEDWDGVFTLTSK